MVGATIRYLNNQRFGVGNRVRCIRDHRGRLRCEPMAVAQPGLTMKGRTPRSLIREVFRFQRLEDAYGQQSEYVWAESGIRPFEKVEERNGHLIRWRITEITTYKDLVEEGRVMHHCVASYARYCYRGQKSVWSLTVEHVDSGYTDRVLTIAVANAARRVVQARGRCNAMPGIPMHSSSANRVLKSEGDRLKRGRAIMRQWGDKEHITVPRVT